MDASIVPFRRDLGRIVSEATSLHAGMTVDDLLTRHRRLATVFGELWVKPHCSPVELELLERASIDSDAFHALARNAGVPARTIDEFNDRREDWKAWAKWRATLPRSSRI